MSSASEGAREFDVALPEGRKLRALETGDRAGRPVFVLHGSPGSRLIYPVHAADGHRRGLRLISYDRPGYGESTPKPGRRMVDDASDVAAIADALGLDRFAVWGHSGGGIPALACAAKLPDRIVAAASLATLAPYPADGLDWLAGMGELNASDFQLLIKDPAAWEKKQDEDAVMLQGATVEELRALFSTLLSDLDRGFVTEDLEVFFLQQGREAVRHGAPGLREDGLAQVRSWGFDLASIRVPLQIWHGRHDLFVPFAHGEWLARHLPGAEKHLEENEGHLSLFVRGIPRVHAWFAERWGRESH